MLQAAIEAYEAAKAAGSAAANGAASAWHADPAAAASQATKDAAGTAYDTAEVSIYKLLVCNGES